MIVSIVTRKSSVANREQWRSRLEGALPKIKGTLEAERGFVGLEYLWGTEDDGVIGQITRWDTLDHCHHYVREGGAATVAMLEDRAAPTAPYPNGAWVRQTFEVADEN